MSEHIKADCPQEDRLVRIEDDFQNHKEWRAEVSQQLSSIEVMMATLNERLKSKVESFDEHIKEGVVFRQQIATTTLGMVITIVVSIVTIGVAYGMMRNQIDVNSGRLNRLEGVK